MMDSLLVPVRRVSTSVVLAFALVTSGLRAAHAQDRQGHGLVVTPDYDCLPAQDFGVAEIRLGEPENTVVRRLGQPRKISKSGGEDDGGEYEVRILSYPNLTIEIVRGEVDRIIIRSPLQPTPQGIRVGDSRAELIGKLGATPRDWKRSEAEVWLVSCEENGQNREDYVIYKLDEGDHIVEILYEASRP